METEQANIFSKKESKSKVRKSRNSKKEENVQLRVCEYLRTKYPNAVWMCDLASGMKLPKHIGAKNAKMRSSSGLPDLFIAATMQDPDLYECGIAYSGLFIELKKDGLRLKDGKLPNDQHINKQKEMRDKLLKNDYCAVIACGVGEAIMIIDEYMNGKVNSKFLNKFL